MWKSHFPWYRRTGPLLHGPSARGLFLVVEGEHDLAFLRRIGDLLQQPGSSP